MESNFIDQNWKKNWQGGLCLLTCDYLTSNYVHQLKKALGVALGETLIVSRRGISTCYFLDKNLEKFGLHFARQAERDNEVIETWAKDFRRVARQTMDVIESLKAQDISKTNLDHLFQVMNEYGIYHRIVKVAVDYLPQEVLDKYLDQLTEARVYAEPVYPKMQQYIEHMAAKIAEKENLKSEWVQAMSMQQVSEYFTSGVTPEPGILKRQYEASVLYVSEDEWQLISDADVVSQIEKSLVSRDVTEISGQVAYPGKAIGTVRIVLDATKKNVFDDGDILVTGMTRPEYLPYLRRSGGFVTDAGGILSHAAITARELKKPCIIGTEVATKVLKDGDMVEVDADKGIVRKV